MEKINAGDFDTEAISSLIDQLKYKSYCYNRNRSPEISPDKFAIIYGMDAYLYEVLYQKELKNEDTQNTG
jgi:hypothetical protein